MNGPLVREIGHAVASLSSGALDALERALEADRADGAIVEAVPAELFRQQARALLAGRDAARVDNRAVSLALAAARDRQEAARAQRVSLVWTGQRRRAFRCAGQNRHFSS